jgi:hypothetical protein
LRNEYEDFTALERAWEQFMAEVNTRSHRVTRRPPVELLGEEHEHLHRLPRMPHTLCFGQTRKVNWQSLISVGGALYSVPRALIAERVLGADRRDGADRRARRRAPRAHGGGPPPAHDARSPGDLR